MNERGLKDLEPYHIEVLRKLVGIFGESLDLNECIALMQIITRHSFRFPDGFVLNDARDVNHEIWLVEAAYIAAALFEDGDKDWRWFKAAFPAHHKETQAFDDLCVKMLDKLKRNETPITFIRKGTNGRYE